MNRKKKAPVRPGTTSGGKRKTVAIQIPLPFESVKYLDPRIARRLQVRTVDRVADGGWQWDAQVSLMVDALQVHIEEAEDQQGGTI